MRHRVYRTAPREVGFDPPAGHGFPARAVAKLCMFLGVSIVGFAFGWVADALGCGIMAAFFWSGVGSMLGCWLGWKIHNRYLQ